jgi:ABC-type phosphate/phosphonate transport system substrate-binding protein
MTFALPMFDLPELQAATTTFWSAWSAEIRRRGLRAPDDRTIPGDPLLNHWRHPDLLISQTCGYPVATALRDQVSVIGTCAYVLPNSEEPGFYRSLLVARADDPRAEPSTAGGVDLRAFRASTVAVNNNDSLSGCVSLGVALVDGGVDQVGNVIVTGGHVASLAAVHSGRADLIAVDAITHALVSDVRPAALDGLVVIGRGPRIPCLPFITSTSGDIQLLRHAAAAAIELLRNDCAHVLRALRISAFVPLTMADYEPTVDLGDRAMTLLPVDRGGRHIAA